MNKPKIIIVDNDLTFRQGLTFLIDVLNKAQVIGKTSTGKELIQLLSNLKPDLIIIDVDIPQINGVELMGSALKLNPHMKIIAITNFENDDYINKLMKVGVSKFLLKSTAIRELEIDIHSLMMSEKNIHYDIRAINVVTKLFSDDFKMKFGNFWLKNNKNFELHKNRGVISI
ncbi:MAG: response regulator transcription factor [Paludibacter sp.]|nr:response regulator transcription factor [Paludibacter sp.]